MSVIPSQQPPPPIQNQIANSAPIPPGLSRVTSPLLLPQRSDQRLRHFPPQVYDLTTSSHLVRFLRVLLGDSGAGQLRKRMLMNRLSQSLASTHFLDLDRFYGAIFGINRNSTETLTVDPYNDTAPTSTWRDQLSADASYRNRIFQFGKGLAYGPSPVGIQLMAEALITAPVDIYESFLYGATGGLTYNAMQSFTYTGLQAFTYSQLQGLGPILAQGPQRKQIIIQPHRDLSLEEAYDVTQVLNKVLPADVSMVVNPLGAGVFTPVAAVGAWADSQYWEISQSITPQVTGGLNPYNSAPGIPIAPSRPPFANYQAEQWFYNNDVAGMLSYLMMPVGTVVSSSDTQRIVWADGSYHDYLPAFALLPWWAALLGRNVSDGVMASNPLAGQGNSNQIGSSTVVPVVMDGLPLPTLVAALAQSQVSTNFRRTTEYLADFWSTEARPQSDQSTEVVEFRFNSIHVINAIAFEVAHFPHHAECQYFNIDTGLWQTVVLNDLYDSIPSILPSGDQYLLDKSHPQHFGAEHWFSVRQKIPPVFTQRMRVILSRGPGSGPVEQFNNPQVVGSPTGQPVLSTQTLAMPYSLGLRRLQVGFSVETSQDLPVSQLPPPLVLGLPSVSGGPPPTTPTLPTTSLALVANGQMLSGGSLAPTGTKSLVTIGSMTSTGTARMVLVKGLAGTPGIMNTSGTMVGVNPTQNATVDDTTTLAARVDYWTYNPPANWFVTPNNNDGGTRFNATDHYSNVTGSTATFTFTGIQCSWISGTNPSLGIAAVSIDGGAAVMIDCYATTTNYQVMLFTSPVLAQGTHTMTITVTGTKNAASNNTFISTDAAIVTPPPPAVIPSSMVTASGQDIIVNGRKIQFVGVNWALAGGCSSPETTWAIANAARQFTHFHSRALYRVWMIPTTGNFQALDTLVAAAEVAGVYLAITLMDANSQCAQAFTFDQSFIDLVNIVGVGGLNAFTTGGTGNSVGQYVTWVNQVVTHVNTITGKSNTQSPAIAWWEIMNENSINGSLVKGTAFYNIIGTYIKSLDPNHLVASGCNTASALDTNNMGTLAQMISAHAGSGIDLVSVHEYDGGLGLASNGNVAADGTSQYFQTALSAANTLHKPVYVGEFGPVLDSPPITVAWMTAKYQAYLAHPECASVSFWELVNSQIPTGNTNPNMAIDTSGGSLQVAVDCFNAIAALVSPNNGG